VTKPFRWLLALLVFLLLALAGLWAGWRWLESPAGAEHLSGWVTARLPDSLRQTQIRLEGIRLRPFSSVEVRRVAWQGADGRPIVALNNLTLTARSGLLTFRPVEWEATAQAEQIGLSGLDKILLDDSWKADGRLTGPVHLWGSGPAIRRVETDLESLKPGGNLKSRVLERLLTILPLSPALQKAGAPQGAQELAQQIRSRPVFHFDIARVSVKLQEERYLLKLFLDGDHLLDLTVRLPKSGLEILEFLNYLGR